MFDIHYVLSMQVLEPSSLKERNAPFIYSIHLQEKSLHWDVVCVGTLIHSNDVTVYAQSAGVHRDVPNMVLWSLGEHMGMLSSRMNLSFHCGGGGGRKGWIERLSYGCHTNETDTRSTKDQTGNYMYITRHGKESDGLM